jgi:hypothetical protein
MQAVAFLFTFRFISDSSISIHIQFFGKQFFATFISVHIQGTHIISGHIQGTNSFLASSFLPHSFLFTFRALTSFLGTFRALTEFEQQLIILTEFLAVPDHTSSSIIHIEFLVWALTEFLGTNRISWSTYTFWALTEFMGTNKISGRKQNFWEHIHILGTNRISGYKHNRDNNKHTESTNRMFSLGAQTQTTTCFWDHRQEHVSLSQHASSFWDQLQFYSLVAARFKFFLGVIFLTSHLTLLGGELGVSTRTSAASVVTSSWLPLSITIVSASIV